MSNNNPTEISCFIKVVTPQAALVNDGRKYDVWLPRSLIEESDDLRSGEHMNITIPEWIAKEKGLI